MIIEEKIREDMFYIAEAIRYTDLFDQWLISGSKLCFAEYIKSVNTDELKESEK